MHRGKEEEREGGMEEEAEGGRVRGLAGHSHNEKNLAAAHCVLVMRSMCRRGALLLISGGSQAFHARLVIGPEGAFILGDSNCERASRGVLGGEARREGESFGSLPPSLYLLSPLCHDQTLLYAGYRITNECPVETAGTGFSCSLRSALSSGGHEGHTSSFNPCCPNRI